MLPNGLWQHYTSDVRSHSSPGNLASLEFKVKIRSEYPGEESSAQAAVLDLLSLV